jgi:chromosome segregation ATPase
MTVRFLIVLLGACAAICAPRADAAEASKLSEADRKLVNEWMAQRAELVVEAHRVERDVQQAWLDPAHTSPDVEKLRARLRELQQELVRAQDALQQKVRELPAVQAKVRQLEEMRAKAQELNKKIVDKTGP